MTRMPLIILVALVLTACGLGPKIEDYGGTEPAFVPEQFFAGKSVARGVFLDRFGTLRRHFTVDIEGSWDGEVLTLVEDFSYADGETDQRIWRLTKIAEGRYEGRANDVEGVAAIAVEGQAMTFSYDLDLSVDGDIWTVNFEDWLYQLDDDVLFNRAVVRRWGIEIGQVVIFFQREPAPAAAD